MASATTTSVKLDQAIEDRVQRLASVKQRSTDWLVREAVEQYVVREEQRQQRREEALAAWEDHQATGLHVSAQEADVWLAKLEAGEDADPPECHV